MGIFTPAKVATTLTLFSSLTLAIPSKRAGVSVQTTFQYDNSCNSTQKAILYEAYVDALALATAAIDKGWFSDYIDWTTEAAIDYWGPQSLNAPYRQRVYDTFVRATETYAGSGWSDWWNDRYVDVYCGGNGCTGTSPGYNAFPPEHGGKYPEIHYCNSFFDILKNHDDLVDAIKKDSSGQMRKNLRNLRSRATTALHEWLHIRKAPSEVCEGGCVDVRQSVGGVSTLSYKAGRAKLLANRRVDQAVNNNDNYVYFAMSRWMQKNLPGNVYPEYPSMWDPRKTPDQNNKIEDSQPGAPTSLQSWELEDSQQDVETSSITVNDPLYPAAVYPSWYRPKMTAAAATTLPAISPPAPSPAPWVSTPNPDNIVCESTTGSPLIADCVHAFGALYEFPQLGALHGKNGGTWWAGYVNSCALAINYHGDWTNACNATLADIQAHSTAIFDACQDGGLGTVGGHVEYANPACPAQIEIIHTSGTPPQGT